MTQNIHGNIIHQLPNLEYFDKPEEDDRICVHLLPDGSITIECSSNRIEEFVELCEEEGVTFTFSYANKCG